MKTPVMLTSRAPHLPSQQGCCSIQADCEHCGVLAVLLLLAKVAMGLSRAQPVDRLEQDHHFAI